MNFKNELTILKNRDINKIFKLPTNKQKVICPPDQVFSKSEFDFMLTIGGDLVDDENEYERLRFALKKTGETEFYIHENLGAKITERIEPFQTTINLNDDYTAFQEQVRLFDPPFGWSNNHFFVYGQNKNWGIYIAEFPTINIIGCDKKLSDNFREAFSIVGNGYADLKEFITTEFRINTDQLKLFVKHYKLE